MLLPAMKSSIVQLVRADSDLPEVYDDIEEDGEPASKRSRNFIARQACENCRSRKTRCNEDYPCKLCGDLGLECIYAKRKSTKTEISMSMMFTVLRRMESKLDRISAKPHDLPGRSELEASGPCRVLTSSLQNADSAMPTYSIFSSQPQYHKDASPQQNVPLLLSFSAHQTIHWPGVNECLPPQLVEATKLLERTYPTRLEIDREPLDVSIYPQVGVLNSDWLSTLGISCVKEVSNAFFETFNRVYPFIDRDFYFLNTLAQVVREGFGYNIESCLVLNILTLGCMGLKASEEGGFEISQRAALSPFVLQVMEEEVVGLSFFNEARRRVGFCLCEQDIQSCQYYLTSAVFFAQTMRPLDEWIMTSRAATSCTAFWKCPPEAHDEWLEDMQSRLFWSAVLLESVIVQELELPMSGLREFEDVVPLPKFAAFPRIGRTRASNSDDSYYHYHFLAQIAHRIILSRIRDTLFHTNPSPKLADELRHQLEQWKANLPKSLNYSDDNSDRPFASPADAVVVALLCTRYQVSRFHLGRPFLYRAIQSPSTLTETERRMCSEALEYAMNWPLTWEICVKMKNFMPLKYFASGQMFGQLLIFYTFRHSPDPSLRELIPAGAEFWCKKMLRFISNLAPASPTIAKDFDILSFLYMFDD